MNTPLISIVVPIYNVEEFLERCLDSILNQTISSKEIILVNDGSTDRSLEIVNQYKENYPEIIVINKKNGGLSSARNAGIEVATGEFIGFVDSDDYVNLEMFEEMVKRAQQMQSDIVIAKYKYIYENGHVVYSKGFTEEKVMDGKTCFGEYLKKRDFANHAVDKIYKLRLFKEHNIRYPEGKYYEDAFTTYKLIYEANNVSYLNKHFYYYFQRDESITNSRFSEKELDYITALKEIGDFIKKENLTMYVDEYQKMCLKVSLSILSKLNSNKYNQKISNEEFKKYKDSLLNFIKGVPKKIYFEKAFMKQNTALTLITIDYKLFYFMDTIVRNVKI